MPMDLHPYEMKFNELFPAYADGRYDRLLTLVSERCANSEMSQVLIASQEFQDVVAILQPVIEIKNYKSQIPFPIELQKILSDFVELKSCIPDKNLLANAGLSRIFLSAIDVGGYELPTLSAMFHFCHPNHFPIVDVNVQAACLFLKESDHMSRDSPRLPAYNAKPQTKLTRYVEFIGFIDALIDARCTGNSTGEPLTYRFMDKALMVLGAAQRKMEKKRKADLKSKAKLVARSVRRNTIPR
jgi:hypothetical protein